MKNVNRQSVKPVKFPTSKRNHAIGRITTLDAGYCVPLACIPLFRGDGVTGRKSSNGEWNSSRINFSLEMRETKDRIVNKVRARFTAYCVPWLAFERFNGSRDEFDRSFAGEQGLAGEVIPFVETHERADYGESPFYDTMGLHGAPDAPMNTMYLEARNLVWKFRAKNRSLELADLRPDRLDETHPPAFWPAGRFEHIKPSVDLALMDGQVALNVVAGQLPVTGLAVQSGQPVTASSGNLLQTGDVVSNGPYYGAGAGSVIRVAAASADNGAAPLVFAEMAENGITVSLSNLDMAKRVQAFAKLRAKYEGHDDDYIIDTYLMNGLELPDQAMKQPFLLADQTVEFTQAQRYATDAGNLDEKAVSGFAQASLTLRVPKLDVGGIIVVQVEILPDQLYERQKDPFLHSVDTSTWPSALEDYADPEKVDIVRNGDIDTDHSVPNGFFGVKPLNWEWNAFGPGVGGEYLKPEADGGTNTARQIFWAHEEVDPALSAGFYLCQGLTKSIFLNENRHGFQLTANGNVVIHGLTQFGPALVEATDNYDKVMGQMDQTRIEQGA